MQKLIDVLSDHKNGKSNDRTFGLVMQGGGMRAAYSAGAILPLVDAGLSDVFDHVVGSSAGALNGAYLISADRNTYQTYTESLTNKNFVNPIRLSKVVDIDYLVDTVLKHKRPIDTEKLNKAKSQLHVVLTDAESGKKEVISEHEEFVRVYEEFRATAAIPILYDKHVLIGNKYYIDGGVSDLLPVDVAIELGCTDIVVVMTQRLEFYRFDKAHTRLVNHLVRRFARKYPESIRKQLPTNEKILKKNLKLLASPPRDINIYTLQPSDEEFLVSMTTIDKDEIRELARLGIDDMEEFLHTDAHKLTLDHKTHPSHLPR